MEKEYVPSIRIDIVYNEENNIKFAPYFEKIDWESMNASAIDNLFTTLANATKKLLKK